MYGAGLEMQTESKKQHDEKPKAEGALGKALVVSAFEDDLVWKDVVGGTLYGQTKSESESKRDAEVKVLQSASAAVPSPAAQDFPARKPDGGYGVGLRQEAETKHKREQELVGGALSSTSAESASDQLLKLPLGMEVDYDRNQKVDAIIQKLDQMRTVDPEKYTATLNQLELIIPSFTF